MLNKIINHWAYQIKTLKFKIEWRKNNSHNRTSAANIFSKDKVTVGNKTYGMLNIRDFGNNEEKLEIGNFVSMSENVYFILGGEHPYNRLSTYPFKKLVLTDEDEATTKGMIKVEDDVWIGFGVTILSGVKIGQGAIVAAGSIVVKDIEPYSIVGGNPCKLIKYRFSETIRRKLIKIDFSKFDDNLIKRYTNILYSEITEENIDKILKIFPKKN